MPRRRTPVTAAATLAALIVVSGCGSQAAPVAAAPSQNSTQVPGTRPSPTIPSGFAPATSSLVATASGSITPSATPQ